MAIASPFSAQVANPVNAIISMQSLHDLGDGHQSERIYRLAKDLLAPGGLFLNADLLHNLSLLFAHGSNAPTAQWK